MVVWATLDFISWKVLKYYVFNEHCYKYHFLVFINLLDFLMQPVKKKHRARVIEFFIDVARECFNIGNFNSLMAIISEYFAVPCKALLQKALLFPTNQFG